MVPLCIVSAGVRGHAWAGRLMNGLEYHDTVKEVDVRPLRPAPMFLNEPADLVVSAPLY